MYIHVYSINMVCIQSPKGHQRQNSQCRRSGRIKKDGEEEERHSKDEIAKRSPIHPSKTKTQANDNTVGLLPPLPAQIRYKNAKIIRTHAHQQQLKKKRGLEPDKSRKDNKERRRRKRAKHGRLEIPTSVFWTQACSSISSCPSGGRTKKK